jgi:hypothetical protein
MNHLTRSESEGRARHVRETAPPVSSDDAPLDHHLEELLGALSDLDALRRELAPDSSV